MLYIIGLGLYDERDITVRGLEAVKKCTRVYLEAYTSILLVDKERLVSCVLFFIYVSFWLRGTDCRFISIELWCAGGVLWKGGHHS